MVMIRAGVYDLENRRAGVVDVPLPPPAFINQGNRVFRWCIYSQRYRECTCVRVNIKETDREQHTGRSETGDR